MSITYVTGDATNPLAKGPKIIAHVCNDIGKWGKGFVLAVSQKWSEPERAYRDWYNQNDDFALGKIQCITVRPDFWVANMVAQAGVGTGSKGPPIRYPALKTCLAALATFASHNGASVHMPRIGCGLAGGKWVEVEKLINETLVAANVAVTVYDLAGARWT